MKMHVITCVSCGANRPRIYIDRYDDPEPTHYTCSATCRNMLEFGAKDEPRTEPGNLSLRPSFARLWIVVIQKILPHRWAGFQDARATDARSLGTHLYETTPARASSHARVSEPPPRHAYPLNPEPRLPHRSRGSAQPGFRFAPLHTARRESKGI